MKNTILICCVAVFCFLLMSFDNKTETGLSIMKKNENVTSTETQEVNLVMILINKSGIKRERKLNWTTKTDEDNNRSALIKFIEPAEVKGTSFLSIEHSDKADDQWLYLPALKRTRKISSAEKSDNFMGSDFTYEDLGKEKIEDNIYTLLGEEIVKGNSCFKIEAIPNDKAKSVSGYTKRIIYVNQQNYLISQIVFFNKRGENTKVLNGSEVKSINQSGTLKTHKLEMRNKRNNHITILHFEDFKVDQPLKDEVFTTRYLESGR